ncbi:MFS transporter [Acuticoccus sp. M5D2P5]|uniref:MFS transporter n=1 Tax=Acuticoccus kalidii TaxID=2910977 RepID=UPI001F25A26B|nr:MFS transporter [Acuticoccus kalidii]MCF3936356.1 MFS transporter [Acuticoccus kalidii]
MSAHNDRLARRNAFVLALAQAMGGSLMSITISIGGLVGVYLLSSTGELATLPVSMMIIGTACGTIPAALILGRLGRRPGFMLGAMLAGTGGIIAFTAIHLTSFPLFCVGTFIGGLSAAFVQQYRFAAAEGASDTFRPKAISFVLAGGMFAGVIGPQTVIATKDLFAPVAFAGSYFAQAILAIVTIGILLFYKPVTATGPIRQKSVADGGRPLRVILTQPKIMLAILCGVVSYSVMSLVMTAAPLAMLDCGFSTADAATGIQWHIISMFGPSFFTGTIISRFGAERVTAVGLVLLALAGTSSLLGITLGHFYTTLILLGLGWNFGFIGGTTMLTAAQRPEERARTQAANDFIVFGSVAIASLSSGVLFSTVGWASINWALLPLVAVPLAFILLQSVSRTQSQQDRLA